MFTYLLFALMNAGPLEFCSLTVPGVLRREEMKPCLSPCSHGSLKFHVHTPFSALVWRQPGHASAEIGKSETKVGAEKGGSSQGFPRSGCKRTDSTCCAGGVDVPGQMPDTEEEVAKSRALVMCLAIKLLPGVSSARLLDTSRRLLSSRKLHQKHEAAEMKFALKPVQ